MNRFTKHKETHIEKLNGYQMQKVCVCVGEGALLNQKVGIYIHTLLYIK